MTKAQTCPDCNKDFTLEDTDISAYKKFGFDPLPQCMLCLHMRRLCFRNERVFYRRKCDATGDSIVSIYHPESPYKVYKADYFWSDKWDPLGYGKEFDFSRPFFEQFEELKLAVPRLAIHNARAENSDYCNTSYGNKDSYLIFGGDYNDHCMFGILCDKNKFSLDIDYCYRNELLYFCSDVVDSYGCHFLFNSSRCSNCYFCDECTGCDECISSCNLKNQSYCIENVKYPKEEYLKRKAELINGSFNNYKNLLEKFIKMRAHKVSRYAHVINCQDCTGDYMKNSKNCTVCFDMSESEDCREIIYGSKIKDCYQCDMLGIGSSLCFNTISTLGVYNTFFTFWGGYDSNLTYCDFCNNSHDLFGCTCLNHQEFCILNKKYPEAEYKILREKIIEHMKKTGEWGNFFPPHLSCFGYNETTANLYWPMDKRKATARGYKWHDKESKSPIPQSYDVPDNIKDVSENILQETLQCISCHKNYKIVEQEFKWLKNNNVPILRVCHDCRLDKRANMRNPRKLWERQCMKCGAKLQSSYAPDRAEKIMCEECYLKEVY